MKYLWLLILFCVNFSAFSLDDGGDWYHRESIKGFEPTLNLEYFGIYSNLYYLDPKGKTKSELVTSNVGVYDIAKNEMNYIFKDTITRSIVSFHYETAYIAEHKTIEFDNSYTYNSNNFDGLFMFANNINVAPRPVSGNIVLVTEDALAKVTTIWVCDKYGNNLRKLFDFSKGWNWELDVKNQIVRLYRTVNGKVEVKNEKY